MMFPLTNRKLIRGCEAHKKAGLGCATDYRAYYTLLFAPFDGIVIAWWGWQGGKWLSLLRENGDVIQFAHLSKYRRKLGEVKQGELLAITGNTGRITTGPHLHIQIKNKNGKRLDPEKYNWGIMKTLKIQWFILGNKTISLPQDEVFNYYKDFIDFEVVADFNLDLIPEFEVFDSVKGFHKIKPQWIRDNLEKYILPEADVICISVQKDRWATSPAHWGTHSRGEVYKNATEIEFQYDPTATVSFPNGETRTNLFDIIIHELSHAIATKFKFIDNTHKYRPDYLRSVREGLPTNINKDMIFKKELKTSQDVFAILNNKRYLIANWESFEILRPIEQKVEFDSNLKNIEWGGVMVIYNDDDPIL